MNDTKNTIAIMLTTLGIIFFVAMAFNIMPWKWAIFLGVACFIVATMTRRLARQRS